MISEKEFKKQLGRCDKEALINLLIHAIPRDKWDKIWDDLLQSK